MNENELRTRRFYNQQLSVSSLTQPEELVRWFGAVQAQDYYGALWGMGLRLRSTTESTVEQALIEKKIVRSWPMRGTLHFTAAEDLKWMLNLLGARVNQQAASRYRQLGLDEEVFAKSRIVIEKSLQGNKQLSRPEIYTILNNAGIETAEQRGIHILGKLARDCVVCFASRQGKQQTFALFDEWIAFSKMLTKEESLGELAQRYFQSHGPATLQDFVWWSGLKVTDAKIGMELVRTKFEKVDTEKFSYWFTRPNKVLSITSEVHLLPSYDEYTVAYKERSAILDPLHARNNDTGNGIFHPPIVINGEVVGLWKRTITKDQVEVTPQPFRALTQEELKSFTNAAVKYAAFLGLSLK